MDAHTAPEIVRADPAPRAPQNLRRSTASGVFWLIFQGMSGRVGSFFAQLALARLLAPAVFGQIGLAYTLVLIVTALVTFGIDDVMLTRVKRLRLWAAPAFWSSLGLGLAGMTVMLAVAPVVARVYGVPGLTGLISILAIVLPLTALSTVPMVRLRAELNFRYIGTYASIETLAIHLATIAGAAAGLGAYSFVLPLPVAAAIKAVIVWRRAPIRLRPGFRRGQYRHIMGNGLLVLGARLTITLIGQGAFIVLGLMASDTVVGIYAFAFRLAAQPLQMLAGSFGSVLFPALTQMAGDPARQMAAALRASRILAYTVTPVCFLQAAVAAPLLHLMFGARWNGAIPLMQILSLGLPGDALSWVSTALLVARGQFTRDFGLAALFAPPFFACAILGAWLGGAAGVAIGVALFYAVVKPLNAWLVFGRAMGLREIVTIYVVPPALAGACIGVAVALTGWLGLSHQPVVQIVAVGAAGPAFYLVALRVAAPSVLREIVEQLPGRVRETLKKGLLF